MTEVELDQSDPTLRRGWRFWNVDYRNGYLLAMGAEPVHENPITNDCTHGSDIVPGPNCRCGIHYVHSTPSFFKALGSAWNSSTTGILGAAHDTASMSVLGRVEAIGTLDYDQAHRRWGDHRALRATSVLCRVLMVAETIRDLNPSLPSMLSERYGCTVGFWPRSEPLREDTPTARRVEFEFDRFRTGGSR